MGIKILSKFQRQDEFLMSSGKKVFIELIVLKLATNKPEFPEGYKFKWIAFNRNKPYERVLFDNHAGKPPHYHENGTEEFFTRISRKHAQQLFYQKVIKKFGDFVQKIN